MGNKKITFIFLIFLMIFIVCISLEIKKDVNNNLAISQKMIDKYVQNIDETFKFQYKEKDESNAYLYYYTSSEIPNFTLVVSATKEGGVYKYRDNYHTLKQQTDISSYVDNLFGEKVIADITNKNNLNLLPTESEMLEYNQFMMNLGILNTETEIQIKNIKKTLLENKINGNFYIYYLSEEQFNEYSVNGIYADVEKFENYTFLSIKNNKIETEFDFK